MRIFAIEKVFCNTILPELIYSISFNFIFIMSGTFRYGSLDENFSIFDVKIRYREMKGFENSSWYEDLLTFCATF